MKKLKFLLLLTPFFFISCEKEKIEGPDLHDLYSELTILESLNIVGDSADFSNNQTMYFTASFSKQIDWTIKIKGLNSSAVKIISGKSQTINQANSTWNGSSTQLPFFIAEDCDLELTLKWNTIDSGNPNIIMHNDTIYNQVNVQSAKIYTNESTVLISDFEGGFNPNFTGFFQSGCTKSLVTNGAGEGNKYLAQYGICDWDWLIGYVDYFSDYWYDQEDLINDPSKLYFNIMINGSSTISDVSDLPNSLFKLEFYEDENGDDYHDASSEDRYDYEFDVNWTGWRMISICYNDLIPPSSNAGDGVKEPSKIINVRTLLLANPESGFAKADVDFLIWSFNAPILD
jgi:hypothetical protein